MNWTGAEPILDEGERVLWREKAKLSLTRGTVRGTLYMTTARLQHVPGRLSRQGHGEIRQWPIEQIKSVWGLDTRDFTTYRETRPDAGSMRKRLHFRLTDGTALLFLVNRRDDAVAKLQGLVGGSEPAAEQLG